jgi:hypothetical protein
MKTIRNSVLCLLWLLAPLSALAVPAEFSDVPTWYDYRQPYDGSGTFIEPYEISKPEHLAQLAYEVNEENNLHEGQFFILTADINLDKTVDGKRVQWIPIGYRSASYKKRYRFHGILLGVDTKKRMNETVWHEGLKHSISGMYINSKGSDEVEYYGLFGRMLGLVMGVQLKDFSIELFQQSSTGIMMVGGLCGALDDNSLDLSCIEYVGGPPFMSMGAGIDGCSVKGKIRAVSGNGGSIYIGGVVATLAENNGMIHTTSSVSIDADKCLIVGGVVAWGLSAIVDCAADAIISVGSMSAAGEGTGSIGGIVGYAGKKMSVRACSSMGTIILNQAPSLTIGGIAGRMHSDTQIRGCSSTMSIKTEKAGYIGGIVGYMMQETGSKSIVDYCAYGGKIDVGLSTNAIGGICGYSEWEKDLQIENCLFTGTISNTEKVAAIVGECKKPSDNVGGCYYDKTMFKGHLCGTEDSHLSIYGLTTSRMTSGETLDMQFLPNDETADYWFSFAKGYYPAVRCNSEWTEYYEPYKNNNSSYLEKDFSIQMFGYENMYRENTVYKTGAWLCSVPVNIPKGDQAYDLVTQVIAPEKNMTWSEAERDVNTNSKVTFQNEDCIRISNDTAYAVTDGIFMATFTMKMAKPVEVWNRPLPLGGTKQLQFTSTVDQVWDGSTATEFAAGTGKKEDPYIIKNGAQLAYAVKNNNEGEWYKQICDITLYVDRHGNAPDNPNPFHSLWIDSSWGKDVKWKAQYDGGSHFVKGAYVDTEGKGLFGDIDKGGAVANLGIIDSHARKGAGLFAGKMNGKITNCIAQGTVGSLHSFDDDYYLDYCGGICSLVGPDNSDAVVEDCISAVYTMMWSFADYTPFVCLSDNNKGVVKNCLTVLPVTHLDKVMQPAHITMDGKTYLQDCYWLKGYEEQPTGFTLEEICNSLGKQTRWKNYNGYFPTLKSFAETDMAKLLMVPFRTDIEYKYSEADGSDNYLLGFGKQLLFEPGAAIWTSSDTDKRFIEADGDMGVIVPVSASINPIDMNNNLQDHPTVRTFGGLEFIKGTFGKYCHYIPVRTRDLNVNAGFTFVDDNARDACLAAFDSNNDEVLSLDELKAVTTEQTLEAFQTATAKKIERFPEFRFFKAVKELTSQLNGLSKLKEVKLPYALETLGSNAFDGCTSLKEVTIPGKVEKVEPHPFYDSAIENVSVDPFNEFFVSHDGILFDTNKVLVAYPNGRKGEEAVITGIINEISEGAIYKVEGLKRIYFETEDYETVPYLEDDGIVTTDGNLLDIYVSDATYGSVLMEGYYSDGTWDDYISAGKLHCYYPLKVGSAKVATMYIGFDTKLPATLTPFIVTKTNDNGICNDEKDNEPNTAYLLSMSRQVPSRSPVVIFAEEAGTYRLEPLGESLEQWKMYKNMLNGVGRDGMSVYQEDSDRGSILTLGYNSEGELGFFYYLGERIAPYRAYLTHGEVSSQAKYHIIFLDETTGINNTVPQNRVQSEKWYTLEGVQLSGKPTSKGIYIYKGKKVVVK